MKGNKMILTDFFVPLRVALFIPTDLLTIFNLMQRGIFLKFC